MAANNFDFVVKNGLVVAGNVIYASNSVSPNVGIGTTIPNALLAVNGTANIAGNVAFGGYTSHASNASFTSWALFGGGLTINSSALATGPTIVNTSFVACGSNVYMNTSSVFVGNATVYAFMNSSALTGITVQSANNSTYFNGQPYSYYANVTNPSFSTSITVGSVVINTTAISGAFIPTANNTTYFAGQSQSYYQSAGGLAANVATLPALSALTANNSSYLGGILSSSYQLNSTLASNVAGMTANNTGYLNGVVGGSYQLNSTLAANVATMSSNNATYFSGLTTGYFANVTSPIISSTLTVGGSSVNSYINSTTFAVGNSTTNTQITALTFTSGATVITNAYINTLSGTFTGIDSGGNGGQLRMIYGSTAFMWRNDGTNLYLLQTASSNQYGVFNGLRPFTVNFSSGAVTIDSTGAGTTFGGPISLQGVIAGSSYGSSGQFLTSTGSSTNWTTLNVSALTSNNSNYLGGTYYTSYQLNSTLSANVATMTANNSNYLGGTYYSSYQLNSTLAANVATMSANNASYLGGVASGSYALNSTLANYATIASLAGYDAIYTSNNSYYLGGTYYTSYQLNSTLSANVATMSANNASYLGGAFYTNYAPLANPHFTGSVGVNTTTPGAGLAVLTGSYSPGAAWTSNVALFGTGAGATNGLGLGISCNTSAGITLTAMAPGISWNPVNLYANNFNLYTAASSFAATFASNGNFGVGTSTPAYNLDVYGTTRSGGLISNAFDTNGAHLRMVYGSSYGVIHRNDGTNYYIMGTAVNSPYGSWSTYPFQFNLSSGAVTMDSGGAGVAFGGAVSVTGVLNVGANNSTTIGVAGYSNSNIGVIGYSNTNLGVVGESYSSSGVYAISGTSWGVQGNGPYGIAGNGTTGVGCQGTASSGYGGWFASNTGYPLWVGNNTTNFMVMVGNGNLGLFTSSPAYNLDVTGNARFTGNAYATDFWATSDKRLKENFIKIDNALDKVCSLNGYTFNFIGKDKRSMGLVAQEVIEVFPEAVSMDNKNMYHVSYGELVGSLVEAIKTLSDRLDKLENK